MRTTVPIIHRLRNLDICRVSLKIKIAPIAEVLSPLEMKVDIQGKEKSRAP